MEFEEITKEFLINKKFMELNKYIAHGNTSVFTHILNVSYLCYKYAVSHKNKKYDLKSLVRGAMMHDMYFYDWHNKDHKRPHGFHHSKVAYQNAKELFLINDIEKDIILKHMFPLTIFKIPRYKESWLVQKMDKKATLKEMKNKQINFSLLD